MNINDHISITKSLPLLQIAETQRYADMAAKQVIIEYNTEDLSPPIVTVEQAVEKSIYFDVPPEFYPKEVGDVSKGMAEADHKIPSTEVF
jgi:xanthine dehydrogenase molybdopterin-binding subunit B